MADYERSACPSCGDSDCSFPPECQSAIDTAPARSYPHHDHDEVECAEPLVEWIRRCNECSRIFDLRDTDDNYEWHYGHDCEVAA